MHPKCENEPRRCDFRIIADLFQAAKPISHAVGRSPAPTEVVMGPAKQIVRQTARRRKLVRQVIRGERYDVFRTR